MARKDYCVSTHGECRRCWVKKSDTQDCLGHPIHKSNISHKEASNG